MGHLASVEGPLGLSAAHLGVAAAAPLFVLWQDPEGKLLGVLVALETLTHSTFSLRSVGM